MKAIIRNLNYYLSSDKALAQRLHEILGFTPYRLSLFKTAFYHKSMNNSSEKNHQNNERLEYLGDAVLSTIVAEYLFAKYPNKDEGFLTKMRSKIVKRTTLNSIADSMGLDVILSEYSQGKMSKAMMGNAFEAMIGAIYLEMGYDKSKKYIVDKILRRYLNIHELEQQDDNYKSKLLEWGQKHGKEVQFKLINRFKFDKRDRFLVGVVIDGTQKATAEDFNKKSAEQTACKTVLHLLEI